MVWNLFQFIIVNVDNQFEQTCRRMKLAYDEIMSSCKEAKMDYNR